MHAMVCMHMHGVANTTPLSANTDCSASRWSSGERGKKWVACRGQSRYGYPNRAAAPPSPCRCCLRALGCEINAAAEICTDERSAHVLLVRCPYNATCTQQLKAVHATVAWEWPLLLPKCPRRQRCRCFVPERPDITLKNGCIVVFMSAQRGKLQLHSLLPALQGHAPAWNPLPAPQLPRPNFLAAFSMIIWW